MGQRKRRGKKLGGNRGVKLTSAARAAGRAVLVEQANARAQDLAPVIAELRADGVASLRGLPAAITARRIPTATGNGKWSAVQVGRVLERLA